MTPEFVELMQYCIGKIRTFTWWCELNLYHFYNDFGPTLLESVTFVDVEYYIKEEVSNNYNVFINEIYSRNCW